MAMWRWACVAAAETYPPTPAYLPFHSHQPTQCLGIFSFEGRSPAGRQSRSEMCEASGFYMKSVWRHLEEFLDFPFYTCYIYPSSLIVNFDKMKCFQILLWIAIYYLPLDRFRWLVFRFIIFHVTVAVNKNFNFIYKTIDIYHPFEPNHLNIKRFWRLNENYSGMNCSWRMAQALSRWNSKMFRLLRVEWRPVPCDCRFVRCVQHRTQFWLSLLCWPSELLQLGAPPTVDSSKLEL